MDGKTLARIGAIILVAAAVTATAVEMTRSRQPPGSEVPRLSAPAAQGPLREGLRHCQVLGEAALRDSGCLRLWAEQRDRFLGLRPFAEPATGSGDRPGPDALAPQGR